MKIGNLKQKLLIVAVYTGVLLIFIYFGLPCVFQYFLSIPCPGCGMTRAVLAALRLDFQTAFGYHPMFWSLPILLLYFLLDRGLFPKKWMNNLLLCMIGLGFALNWIINLI